MLANGFFIGQVVVLATATSNKEVAVTPRVSLPVKLSQYSVSAMATAVTRPTQYTTDWDLSTVVDQNETGFTVTLMRGTQAFLAPGIRYSVGCLVVGRV